MHHKSNNINKAMHFANYEVKSVRIAPRHAKTPSNAKEYSSPFELTEDFRMVVALRYYFGESSDIRRGLEAIRSYMLDHLNYDNDIDTLFNADVEKVQVEYTENPCPVPTDAEITSIKPTDLPTMFFLKDGFRYIIATPEEVQTWGLKCTVPEVKPGRNLQFKLAN